MRRREESEHIVNCIRISTERVITLEGGEHFCSVHDLGWKGFSKFNVGLHSFIAGFLNPIGQRISEDYLEPTLLERLSELSRESPKDSRCVFFKIYVEPVD